MSISRTLLSVLSLAVSIVIMTSATAQADPVPKKYAIASLIGDGFTIVTYRRSVGSHLDQNAHDRIATNSPALDHTAMLATDDAVHKVMPNAATLMLAASAPSAYASAANLFDDKRFLAPEWLAPSLQSEHATHLILITKLKAETNIRFADGNVGTGKLEGVGFYVDHQLRTQRLDTGESGNGFLAPFAYIKVSLIDLASGTVIKEQRIAASRVRTTAHSKDAVDASDALTPIQKLKVMQSMLKNEIGKAVGEVLKTEG